MYFKPKEEEINHYLSVNHSNIITNNNKYKLKSIITILISMMEYKMLSLYAALDNIKDSLIDIYEFL